MGKSRTTYLNNKKYRINPSDEVYLIEKILDVKVIDGKKFYLIKWENFGNEYNTWEPYENLSNVIDMINDFENQKNEYYLNLLDGFFTKNKPLSKISYFKRRSQAEFSKQNILLRKKPINVRNSLTKTSFSQRKKIKSKSMSEKKIFIKNNLRKLRLEFNEMLKEKSKKNNYSAHEIMKSKYLGKANEADKVYDKTTYQLPLDIKNNSINSKKYEIFEENCDKNTSYETNKSIFDKELPINEDLRNFNDLIKVEENQENLNYQFHNSNTPKSNEFNGKPNEICNVERFEVLYSKKGNHNDRISKVKKNKLHVKSETENDKNIQIEEFGSFEKGDIPSRVIEGKISPEGKISLLIEWKCRDDNTIPLPAIYSNEELRKRCSHLLIQFYERKILKKFN